MEKALANAKGRTIRLYTVSAVESYVGEVQDVNPDYVTLKEANHGQTMYVALQHVECFHEQPH